MSPALVPIVSEKACLTFRPFYPMFLCHCAKKVENGVFPLIN
jgi:hypothetical protein